jgi:Fic family protein
MSQYIHNLPDWPHFRWDRERLAKKLAAVRHEQGRLLGRMESLGFPLRQQAVLDTLTADVLKSSEIEGETWTWRWSALRSPDGWASTLAA